MDRRDVLKLLGSATALSALPVEALTLIQQASAQVGQSTALKTLNPHQNATVITISELIIPATDTPGAKDAKVNEFIDLLLTEWFEPAETKQFLAGLADVDACSKEKFSAAFIDSTPAQQTEVLKQLDTAAMDFAAKQKQAMQTHAAPPPMNFFYQMKKLTLAGYYTSEIGFSQELGKRVIPPSHAGCAPLQERAAS
jgi:Gluconate 2-dehydrogenase subunit 3